MMAEIIVGAIIGLMLAGWSGIIAGAVVAAVVSFWKGRKIVLQAPVKAGG